MRNLLTFAALAAATAFASPAAAQVTASANADARALIIQPLTLVRVSDLNFGTIISTNAAGSVTVSNSGDTRSADGGAVLAPSGLVSRGLFQGQGTPGQLVVISTNFPGSLVNQSAPTESVGFTGTVEGPLIRTIGTSGAFQVGVGGTINLGANQLAGLYSAPFEVTADYQ